MARPDIWVVKVARHRTQQEAIDAARPIAEEDEVEMIWQGDDGQIQGRNSYGNDPRDVPG